jgi:hypothetical protein
MVLIGKEAYLVGSGKETCVKCERCFTRASCSSKTFPLCRKLSLKVKLPLPPDILDATSLKVTLPLVEQEDGGSNDREEPFPGGNPGNPDDADLGRLKAAFGGTGSCSLVTISRLSVGFLIISGGLLDRGICLATSLSVAKCRRKNVVASDWAGWAQSHQ